MKHLIQPPKLHTESLKATSALVLKQCKKFQYLNADNFVNSVLSFRRFLNRTLVLQNCSELLLQEIISDDVDPMCYCVLFLHEKMTKFRFIATSKQIDRFHLKERTPLYILSTMPNLISLEICQELVNNELLRIIGQRCTKLEDLRLNGGVNNEEKYLYRNYVTPTSLTELIFCTNLKRLYLPEYSHAYSSQCPCFHCCDGLTQVAIFTLLNCLHSLEYINWRTVEYAVNAFGTAVCFNLTEIDIEEPDPELFEGLRLRCSVISKLKLTIVDESSADTLFNELSKWKFNLLTDLEVMNLPLYDSFLKYLDVQGCQLVTLTLTFTHTRDIMQMIGYLCPSLHKLNVSDYTPTGESFPESKFDANGRMFESLETLTLRGITWCSTNVIEKCLSFASRIRIIHLDNFTGSPSVGLDVTTALQNVNCYNEFEHLEELCCFSGLFVSHSYLKDLTETCFQLKKVCVPFSHSELNEIQSLKQHITTSNMALVIETL